MSAYFPGTELRERWFRIGNLEVGSTMLVVLVAGLMMLAGTVAPGLVGLMAFSPSAVGAGGLWRVFTWPFAATLGLGGVLNLFFLWIFGSELEQQLGRRRMAWLLAGTWAVFTLVAVALWAVSRQVGGFASPWLYGLGEIEFALLLLWIAEYPRRPFFFGIPAWVVGAVLAGLQLLGPLVQGDLLALLRLLVSAALIALLAKQLGLLSQVSWIPGRARSTRRRPTRQQRAARQLKERQARDAQRLDELLDLISANGLDSLSSAQRRELMRLRSRR